MTAIARFSDAERAVLLAVKGVGPTVVSRFEQLGIASLADLARQDEADICKRIALLLGSTCWGNSPQARSSVAGAISAARNAHDIR
ncbi:MAG: helix-hairpin-helix domain-containing protein [Novosphingobium sp.]